MTTNFESDASDKHRKTVADMWPCIEQLREYAGAATELDLSDESLVFLDTFLAAQRNLIGKVLKDDRGNVLAHSNEETWLITRLAYYIAAYLQKKYQMEWHVVLGNNKNAAYYGESVLQHDFFHTISPFTVAFNIWHQSLGDKAGLVKYIEGLEKMKQLHGQPSEQVEKLGSIPLISGASEATEDNDD